jgi:hypothetical protein
MPGDAVQPGREGPGLGKPGDAAKNLEPHLLGEIVRGVTISHHLADEIVQRLLVHLDQLLEGGTVPGLAAHDQEAPADPVGAVDHVAPAS